MMPIRILNAIFLIATSSIMTGAWGQTTYKCGNSYSQQPCAGGGTVVDTTDSRTSAQKQAADQASQRNAQAAAAMEKARLQKDKADLQAVAPKVTPAKPVKPTKPKAAASSPKDSQPAQKTAKKPKLSGTDEFKAQVPGEPDAKDKKKAAKKMSATD
jgi:hypothetical protein